MKGSVLAEEIDEQYNLDGLEKSVGLAKDNNLSRELIDMIKEAHIFLTDSNSWLYPGLHIMTARKK